MKSKPMLIFISLFFLTGALSAQSEPACDAPLLPKQLYDLMQEGIQPDRLAERIQQCELSADFVVNLERHLSRYGNLKVLREALEKRAAHNDPMSQIALFIVYIKGGPDTPADPDKAVGFAVSAAEQGFSLAHWLMGEIYRRAFGAIKEDPVEAYKWLLLAEARGFQTFEEFAEDFKRLLAPLSPQQRAEAKRRAAQWEKDHGPDSANITRLNQLVLDDLTDKAVKDPASNEFIALETLNQIASCAASYKKSHPGIGFPPDPRTLGPETEGCLDTVSANAVAATDTKAGYSFVYKATRKKNNIWTGFTLAVRPLRYGKTGTRSFFTDEAAVVRFTKEDRPATASDPPVEYEEIP